MAVSTQNLTTVGPINTQIENFLTFLTKKIAKQAKMTKKMEVLRHIWRLLLLLAQKA